MRGAGPVCSGIDAAARVEVTDKVRQPFGLVQRRAAENYRDRFELDENSKEGNLI